MSTAPEPAVNWPEERRVHARLPIVTAVEVWVGDTVVHAVVSDASAGGMRLELASVAARLFTEPTAIQVHDLQVGVAFLQPALRALGILQGKIRWVRPAPRGCSVGVHLLSESHQQLVTVLEVLQADGARKAIGRQRVSWSVAALLLVCMAILTRQHLNETANLRHQLTKMSATLRDTRAALDAAQDFADRQAEKFTRLRDDFDACQTKQIVSPSIQWVDVSPEAEAAPTSPAVSPGAPTSPAVSPGQEQGSGQ